MEFPVAVQCPLACRGRLEHVVTPSRLAGCVAHPYMLCCGLLCLIIFVFCVHVVVDR